MAAVTSALLCFLKAGDHIVAARALFGSCRYVVEDLCPRFGIASHAGRRPRPRRLASAPCAPTPRRSSSRRRPTRRSTWSTSPPSREIAHAAGALVVVDNVFATPLLQKPLKLGADVVVYSATKHIDGQGRCLGGVVLGSQKFLKDHLHNFLQARPGPSLSPFNAWVMLKGLETLPLRVRAQCETARAGSPTTWPASRASRACSICGRADYPQAALARRQMTGGGQVVTFEIDGGKAAAFRFLNALRIVTHLQQPRRRQEPHHASRPPPRTSA